MWKNEKGITQLFPLLPISSFYEMSCGVFCVRRA
jgi:hypothetical protein